MATVTTITTGPWVFLEYWPELDAAVESWRVDADLDQFAEVQRAVDGWLFVGFDLGRQVDLDRVIEHVRP